MKQIKDFIKKEKSKNTIIYLKDDDRVVIKGLAEELNISMTDFVSYMTDWMKSNRPWEKETDI